MKNRLKSMTAYGRAEATTDLGLFTLEVQTLNRRHLEINLALPRSFTPFEMPLRKQIAASISRGQVTVTARWVRGGKEAVRITPNLPLARALKEAWETIGREVGAQVFDIQLLAKESDILHYEEALVDETHVLQVLEGLLGKALAAVVEMRLAEGEALAADLAQRTCLLEKHLAKIEAKVPGATVRQREKLTERIEELFSGSPDNEERILKEIALFAERVDVTEEIVRFKSHLAQVQGLLEKEEPIGKMLEFLLQELGREINTIGSKSADASVSGLVLECKGELEKMREQVQNIE